MNIFFVKAGFSNLRDSELVIKASTIIECLNGNNNFLEPSPPMLETTAALGEFKIV